MIPEQIPCLSDYLLNESKNIGSRKIKNYDSSPIINSIKLLDPKRLVLSTDFI